MADDDTKVGDPGKTEGDAKPKADDKPAFDAEALGKQIAAATAQQVAQALQTQPDPKQPQTQEPEDALGQVVEPYVQRGVAKAALIAQMAADKADFYAVSDPDELEDRLTYKDEIEKRALALAAAGRALPREDIFKHLKGEKFGEFSEKAAKRKAKREQRAQEEGGDQGPGALRTRGGDLPAHVSAEAAHDLQGKGKLDEFLGDKAF